MRSKDLKDHELRELYENAVLNADETEITIEFVKYGNDAIHIQSSKLIVEGLNQFDVLQKIMMICFLAGRSEFSLNLKEVEENDLIPRS